MRWKTGKATDRYLNGDPGFFSDEPQSIWTLVYFPTPSFFPFPLSYLFFAKVIFILMSPSLLVGPFAGHGSSRPRLPAVSGFFTTSLPPASPNTAWPAENQSVSSSELTGLLHGTKQMFGLSIAVSWPPGIDVTSRLSSAALVNREEDFLNGPGPEVGLGACGADRLGLEPARSSLQEWAGPGEGPPPRSSPLASALRPCPPLPLPLTGHFIQEPGVQFSDSQLPCQWNCWIEGRKPGTCVDVSVNTSHSKLVSVETCGSNHQTGKTWTAQPGLNGLEAARVEGLKQRSSRATGGTSIACESVKNALSWASPQTYRLRNFRGDTQPSGVVPQPHMASEGHSRGKDGTTCPAAVLTPHRP